MKKLFITCGLILTSILIFAQGEGNEDQGKKKKMGPGIQFHAGFNSSTLSGDNSSDNKSLSGFHAGMGIQALNFSDVLGIRTELTFSQQGDKYSYGESGYSSENISRLNYLNLPVLVHYQSKSGFFAEAGLQPGLLLSAKEKSKSSGMGGDNEQTTDIKKDINSFSLGVPIGAGYVIKKKFAISARVAPGLLNVDKKDGVYSDLTEKNFVLSARLSYFL